MKALRDRFEVPREAAHVDCEPIEVPLNPMNLNVVLYIEVLVGANDVSIRAEDEVRNGGGDALLVGATSQMEGV